MINSYIFIKDVFFFFFKITKNILSIFKVQYFDLITQEKVNFKERRTINCLIITVYGN